MLAQCICNALVSADIVQASTMHKEFATKTVSYCQWETVMQSVAMLTADYRVGITEKVGRHQVDAQSTTPLGYGGCYSVQRWTVASLVYTREFCTRTSQS